MRNSVFAVTLTFVLAAPCTTHAEEKKTIDVQSFSFGATNAGSTGTGASSRVVSPTMQKKHIGQPKYEDVQSQSKGPLNTKVNPALQGSALGGTSASSRMTIKMPPEYTRNIKASGKP
jgi:hypothetical protein